MVSLDDAVLARWEYGGKRYEVLVDPELVEDFQNNTESVDMMIYWQPMRYGTTLEVEIGPLVMRLRVLLGQMISNR